MKRLLSWVLVICLCISLMSGFLIIADAATSLPSDIFLAQVGNSTCTLSAAAMMLRGRMYLSGNSGWGQITESGIKSVGWLSGSGLRYGFTYSLNGNSVTVAHTSFSGGISIATLKSTLNAHPEGIVFYVRDLPHAVYLTDYDGDTFYCADPLSGYSGKRIPLASSYLGRKLGSQAAILNAADDYWYVSSYSITNNMWDSPTTATLSVDNSYFKIGEDFTFTLSSDTGCDYYLSIIDADSGEYIIQGEKTSTTYKNAFQRAGHYTAWMSAANSSGSKDSNFVDFWVFGSPPTSASLSTNKTKMKLGETVTLTTSTDAYYVRISIALFLNNDTNNGTQVCSGEIPYNYNYTPSENGTYTGYVTAWTHEGGVDSNLITFQVGEDRKPVDVGTDFYAYIINTSPWKMLTNDSPNVSIRTETATPNQVWYFERLNDGSYKITSALDGYSLDVHLAGTEDGTNLKTDPYTGHAAQQWWISGSNGECIFSSKCANTVIDVSNGSSEDGTNVQMWTYNGTDAQKFHIWKLDNFVPPVNDTSAPNLSGVTVTDITPFGYTVVCTATDSSGIDRVQFPTWTTHNGQDDLVEDWRTNSKITGVKNGDTYTFRVNTLDHNYELGEYTTYIYAYDKHGNYCEYGVPAVVVPNAVKEVSVTDISTSGYTVSCKVSNIDLIDRVQFPTWTTYGGQDDLVADWSTSSEASGIKSGDTYTFRVNTANHNNEANEYITYIYAFDKYGNRCEYGVPAVNVPAGVKLEEVITNNTADNGDSVSVTVKASGEGLTYEWYFKDVNQTEFSKSTVTTASYSTTMSQNVHGRQLYCVITDAYGNTVQTNTITLYANVFILNQPKTTYTRMGKTAKATVVAEGEGLTYQWYIKNAGKTKYSKSSVTSATYSCKMSETSKDRLAYCIITDANGNSIKSDTVRMRMAASVTTQPKSVVVAKGANAKVTFKAAGDGLKYEWYFKDAGASSFKKTSSFTGNTYQVAMSAARHGRQIYCKVTDKYGKTVKTNTVTLSMKATITAQPKTSYTKLGSVAKVTVTAVGDGLTYQWYVKDVGDSTYTRSSHTTNTCKMQMSTENASRKAYCVIKDKYGNTVKTNTVEMRMAASIATQPNSVSVANGATAKVTVKAAGDGLKYQWYIKNAGGSSFSKSSVTAATYSCKMSKTTDGRKAYCVVTDKYGNTVKTNTVTLSMK